ncbi:asparagine synthetase B family protein [Spongorhabdus nitratireducens]
MCGFFITNNPNVDHSHLSIIESTLRFRGPDCSSGLLEHNSWKAYHSRLAIIDVYSGVNQPIIDSEGGMLVFNGEVLNYKELGKKYFNRNYTSDTKLLSDLLASNKINLNEIDGFFAFVYINKDGKVQKAARDKFGVKPIFYHRDGKYLSFCSEPITLKKIFKLSVNHNTIDEYRATRAPIFSGSYFDGINTIQPGNCFIDGEYFNCCDFLEKEYIENTENDVELAIREGIRTRQISDAPVGLLLSRGIDSNLLKEFGNIKRCYSIGFEGDEDIEYLKKEETKNLKIIEQTAEGYLNDFKHLIELRGEPMSVPNEVLLYRISREAAKDGIKVLLSGEGADEFFGGYDRIFQWALKEDFCIDKFIEMYCYEPPKKGSKLYQRFKNLFLELKVNSSFEMVRWFFIKYHMPVLFRRLDFALMAAGIEGREPLANKHTFEIATKISPKSLMGDVLGKIPLRNIISKYKGNDFAYEKKVGFPVNLKKVFKDKSHLSSYEIWFEENIKVLYK